MLLAVCAQGGCYSGRTPYNDFDIQLKPVGLPSVGWPPTSLAGRHHVVNEALYASPTARSTGFSHTRSADDKSNGALSNQSLDKHMISHTVTGALGGEKQLSLIRLGVTWQVTPADSAHIMCMSATALITTILQPNAEVKRLSRPRGGPASSSRLA